MMEFYEADELNRDATNWWGPNAECLLRMARSSGFELVELQATTAQDTGERVFGKKAGELIHNIRKLFSGSNDEFYAVPKHRAIIHAWKNRQTKEAFNKTALS
jgi:hypothetical protein